MSHLSYVQSRYTKPLKTQFPQQGNDLFLFTLKVCGFKGIRAIFIISCIKRIYDSDVGFEVEAHR